MNEFNNLPASVKIGGGALGVVTIGGASWFLTKSQLLIFLGVLIVLMVLFVCGWLLWRASKRRRNNAQISGGLVDDARATPKGISDPAKRAKLDDLRKKFQQGVQEYRSRGKDLYKLPWYVICGPPGAGKTEAIRHCNVGFPPGMQDGLQGVGGTINMNWWFTNQAVILDTAGKLMFEEVSPGETSEWREFLTLLKKSRTNCPINGLFLAISVEDLIKDSSEKILQKAGKIAQQLDVIQRVLDVRFPVYVIVTKCDLLAGFREFFDDITDPQLQHQMVGWSNPETLDTAFRPELIDQHLKSVSQRLRGRRMGLLRDPIPESTEHRRTDEVDAMFALPNSLTLIGPRLRRYLETIFVAGEWSAKPLFLRGIYFTSSMREGSALDEELAQAIGVPVGELPDRRGWERERSYFLRDLFMEKVFKERGLVTRATNTGQMLRRRRAVLFGTGFAFVAVFFLFCFFGQRKFQAAIGEQASYWKAAETAQPIVRAGKAQSKIAAKAADGYPLKGNPTLGQFHARLRELASTRINYSVFRPIAWISGGDVDLKTMKQAQASAFERDIIWPLVTEARRKLDSSSPEAADVDGADRESAAWESLVQLEARLLRKEKKEPLNPLSRNDADLFLSSLMAFVTDQKNWPVEQKSNLVATMTWLYIEGAHANDWPPQRLGETSAGNTRVIVPTFTRLMKRAEDSAVANTKDTEEFLKLRNAYAGLSREETTLLSKISTAGSGADLQAALQHYRPVLAEWQSVLSGARTSVLKDHKYSSESAYINSVDRNRRRVVESLQQASKVLDQNKNLIGNSPFREMAGIVERTTNNLNQQLVRNSAADAVGQRALDRWAWAEGSTGALYQARAEVYQSLANLAPAASAKVGARFEGFKRWQDEASALQKRIAGAGVESVLVTAASSYLDRNSRSLARDMLSDFVQDASRLVQERLDYPLIRFESASQPRMDTDLVIKKKQLLIEIEADMQALAFTNLMASQPGVTLTDFNKTLSLLRGITTALLGEDNTASACRIDLNYRKQGDKGPEDWRADAGYALFNEKKVRLDYAKAEAGQIALDLAIDFKFYTDQEMKDLLQGLSVRYDKWAPIQMLHQGSVDPDEVGLVRTVEIKVERRQKESANQSMQFELKFTNKQPLPRVREWPTRASVKNGLQIHQP